jgi:hypothetical protein
MKMSDLRRFTNQFWCAASPRLNGLGGVYCENVEIARVVSPDERSGWASDDSTRKVGVMPHAIDPVSAERFWSVSVEMTGALSGSHSRALPLHKER